MFDDDYTEYSISYADQADLGRMSMDDVVAELDGCASHAEAAHLADNCNGEVKA